MSKAARSRYLIANETDPLWGLVVNTIGHQSIDKGEHYPLKNHPKRYQFSTKKGRILNEYQLLYITEGRGTFESDAVKQTAIKAGNMFLLFPDEWHSYNPDPQTGWEEYWIGFEGTNIDSSVRNGFFNKHKPVFYVGVLEEIVQLYKQGIVIANEQKAGHQQMLAGVASHLLSMAYSIDKNTSFDNLKVKDCINRAKIIFMDNFAKNMNLQKVAEEVNLSYSRFRYLFKEYTGFAPAQYLQELRIVHSKELLANTTLSINEIAFECGFETCQYFCIVFKNKIGSTPTEYRKFTQGENA